MLISENDTRFLIGASTIAGAGNGLFARVPLVPGERLEVIGILVRAHSAADQCTRFADAYKFRVGADLLLIPVGFAALVNHSLTPNMEKVVEEHKVYLGALRAIAAGEELVFTYSAYAQDRFGLR
jgi:hypothetical protein